MAWSPLDLSWKKIENMDNLSADVKWDEIFLPNYSSLSLLGISLYQQKDRTMI